MPLCETGAWLDAETILALDAYLNISITANGFEPLGVVITEGVVDTAAALRQAGRELKRHRAVCNQCSVTI